MHTRPLGRTGLDVSVIGLGTWALAAQIYGDVSASDAHATVRAALDGGVTVFDTAPLYGSPAEEGISEVALGRALGADRDRVLVFSKFGRSSVRADTAFSAAGARASVEGSLRRLGRSHLDLLFFHSPFGAADIHDDVWDELGRLRDEGKVRFVGHSISKFADTAPMARRWADERRIDVVQVVLSLMNREAAPLIEDLAGQGVGIVAREVLANGFLSGAVTADTVFPVGTLNARYDRAEVAARADYADALTATLTGEAAGTGLSTLPEAAVRWALDAPGVTMALSGASSPAQLASALAAASAPPLPADRIARVAAMHARDFEAA